MVVLYLPIQSKSEDSSSSLVCFLMLFNNHISFLFCTIQFRFTNTSTRSTTVAITIKDNGTKSTSITNNSSFLDKDRRGNKVNNITFVKSFQIIIPNRICYLCLLYPIRLIISLCKTYLLP